ncbi:hypothetical protein D1007_45134 [Hordeum vulgare]|nr:hypothetical protein D1007_45134 [Hordeum vulgare]
MMPNYRTTTLCAAPKVKFSSREAYALARFGGVESAIASFLWSTRAPSHVMFFGWLLLLGGIHTRDVLLRKTILSADEAGCPCRGAKLETANHLIYRCPFAVQFWRCVGLSIAGALVGALKSFDAFPVVGATSPGAFVLL